MSKLDISELENDLYKGGFSGHKCFQVALDDYRWLQLAKLAQHNPIQKYRQHDKF